MKREATHRLEEWREERRRNKELEEEQRLAEEVQKRRQAKVTCVVTCVFLFLGGAAMEMAAALSASDV